MAYKLIAVAGEAGITTGKFVRYRESDGAVWSTSGTPAFEAYNASNIANYGIAATEVGSTGVYTATDPAEGTFGSWLFVKAAGASLAVSDLVSNVYYTGESDSKDVNVTLIEGTDATDQLTTYGGGSSITAADVWTYATRTLTGPAASYSPTHAYGQLRLIRGESYGTGAVKDLTTGVANGGSWPTDLSDYTWSFVCDPDASNTTGATWSGTVSVATATGSSRAIRITIAASTTAASGITAGKYTYCVQGYKTSDSTFKVVPESGVLLLAENPAV